MVWLNRLILFISILNCSQCSHILQCQFATPTKYFGYFSVFHGIINNDAFASNITNSSIECKERCRTMDNCLSVSYNMSQYCSFFNTTFVTLHYDNSYANIAYLWYRCNWYAWSYQPKDGRCKGMFIGYIDYAFTVTFSFMELNVMKEMNENTCLNLCSSNPVCKIVNYNVSENICTFYQGWPNYYVERKHRKGINTYDWTCIPNFIETLPWDQTPEKVNDNKCTGYWKIIERDMDISNLTSPGAFFYTQSFKECLKECSKRLICSEVWFNVTYSICIIPTTDISSYNKYTMTYLFIRFQWICSRNDSHFPKETDEEKRLESLGFRCVALVNNSDVFIAKDNCGKPSEPFNRCSNPTLYGKWNITDSCLVDQVFWVLEKGRSYDNITQGKIEFLAQIFTGLTSYWIVYSNSAVLEGRTYLECRRFDASNIKEKTNETEIVNRNDWYALPARGRQKLIDIIPKNHIIVDSSELPFFGCRTKMSCTSILRNLQIRYFHGIGPIPRLDDIPYNFMLNEDGTVYEVRGWTQRCAAFPDYPKSFCFAFIGSFSQLFPTIEFLRGLKKLINLAVSKGYVVQNYTVYVYSDATKVRKRMNLALIVKNWYAYRYFRPESCKNVSYRVLVVNLLALLLTTSILFISYRFFVGRKKCSKCTFLHSMQFNQIYPNTTENEINETEGRFKFHIFFTKHCFVTEKYNVFSPNRRSRFVIFVKLWFLNMYLETSNSSLTFNNFSKYLNTVIKASKHIQVYKGMLSTETSSVLDNLRVILCFSNKNSMEAIQEAIRRESCLCQLFTIDFPLSSNLEFSI